ncbi:Cupin domain protein [Marinomonas spartinae]|uniref:Cupin domain protein n=1 Tax=Marinomonas spartinae TaxID=1792290 RepID=A0A1A8TTX1_9GAMM|nr:cupin domain-containing protein [Marinomonas spartinae]SBS29555.1 Cupin domain protein [Marinomonas spartinae]SBS36962.1 Cupin domain protein [Marinomonas spartinae]
MSKLAKKSIETAFSGLEYLPNRTPEMAFSGGASKAFLELSQYRDGAIYVGHYSGNSEWERHSVGDEIVMALEGTTTLVLLIEGQEEKHLLNEQELFVVPKNVWHRFESSTHFKVMTVTPQPTDHSLERPTDS